MRAASVRPETTAYGSAYAPAAWTAAAQPVRLPRLAGLGLQLIVLGSLFTGLAGPSALGEVRGEGVLLGIGLLLMFVLLSGVVRDTRAAQGLLVFLPFVVCVLLSYAVNSRDIASAHFLGREGGEKFVSSLLVLGLYGSAFYAILSVASVYGTVAVLQHCARAAGVAATLIALEMVVEIVTWFSPSLRHIWILVRHLWTGSTWAPPFRLVGFAPEPSFASITALGLMGLLACAAWLPPWRQGVRPATPWIWGLIASLFVLQALANSRTFMAGALGAGVAGLLLAPTGRALPAGVKSAAIVLLPLAVQAGLIWTVRESAAAHSVSDITRSIGMLTGAKVWAGHPFFGVGLGQYGFHFRAAVPAWGLKSWEISRYFRPEQFHLLGGLPPSYSLFTRLGAELGLVGFLSWVLPALYAIRRALIRAPGPLTAVMVCAFAAQIWTGLSLDSFRSFFYWFWLACLLAWPAQAQAAGSQNAPHLARWRQPPPADLTHSPVRQ